MASSDATPEQAFVYQPLDTSVFSIRLLEIRRKYAGMISFHLKQNLTLDQAATTGYTALSYTWGPPEPVQQIEIDGTKITVRKNLYDFLSSLRPSRSEYNHIWIDQICIDQEAVHERNHQVSMMVDIYRRASCVKVWLGIGDPDSNLAIRFSKHVHN
jgi:hypothetical protein